MKAEEVEESLRKRFRKELFSKFCKAINEYNLIEEGDKIAVCISGGKDSFLMAKLFQELKRRRDFMESRHEQINNQKEEKNLKTKETKIINTKSQLYNSTQANKNNAKHITKTELRVSLNETNAKTKQNSKIKIENLNSKSVGGGNKDSRHFELVFLCMNPGYNSENLRLIKQNAKALNIPLTIFKTDIFKNVEHVEKSPCYLCARMRRGYLYSKAKELGCNKIALGHHYDDVIETILMGTLFSGQFQTMMPKLKSTNFAGMQLIRPMYLIREKDILDWVRYNNLKFLQCACRFTEKANCDVLASKRAYTKQLIQQLKKEDEFVESNIFKSAENVNLNTIISYKDKRGKLHHFLDEF